MSNFPKSTFARFQTLLSFEVFIIVINWRHSLARLFGVDLWKIHIIFWYINVLGTWAWSSFTAQIWSLLDLHWLISSITSASRHILEWYLRTRDCLKVLMLTIGCLRETQFEDVLRQFYCSKQFRFRGLVIGGVHNRTHRSVSSWKILLDSFDNNWHF